VASRLGQEADCEDEGVGEQAESRLWDAEDVGEGGGAYGIAARPCLAESGDGTRVVVEQGGARAECEEKQGAEGGEGGSAMHRKCGLYRCGQLASGGAAVGEMTARGQG